MIERLNILYLFIGVRGCGKTTLAEQLKQIFLKLNEKNKCIVVDTTPHPFYADYTTVSIEDLATCKDQLIRCEDANDSELFDVLNKYQSNAFVIFEDARKYISSNVSRSLRSCVIDMRKRNFDFVFMFHSLKDVPPYLAENYDKIVLYKTGDNFDEKQPKFSNWQRIKEAGLQLQKSKDHHAHKVIKM